MAITKKRIAEYLVAFKGSVNMRSRDRVCPFHYAASVDCKEICPVIFPRLIIGRCPCHQYKLSYVQKVARKFIKDNINEE